MTARAARRVAAIGLVAAARRVAAIGLVAVGLGASACAVSDDAAVKAPVPTITSPTTRGTTVAADVSLPSAKALDLDLPGVVADLDVKTCTARVSIEAASLQFNFDSAELPATGSGRDVLDAVLDRFAPASTVQVIGHASTEGNADRNGELSSQRAVAVAEAGRASHPDIAFVPVGVGSTSTTVVEDGTEATRSKNRRVELTGTAERGECQPAG